MDREQAFRMSEVSSVEETEKGRKGEREKWNDALLLTYVINLDGWRRAGRTGA